VCVCVCVSMHGVMNVLYVSSHVAMHGQSSYIVRNLLCHITEQVGSGGNAWDLYLDGASFESWPGHQLSRVEAFLVVFLSITRQMFG
jgi:hypothetical protein